MVRTKADRVPTKVVGSKAPHKVASSNTPSKSTGSSKKKNYSGGNAYHPRDTPEWQKPITCFLNQGGTEAGASSSEYAHASSSKENEDPAKEAGEVDNEETD